MVKARKHDRVKNVIALPRIVNFLAKNIFEGQLGIFM